MIAKAVVTALSFQVTDFPKAPEGQPPNETFTYYDEETERDPRAVTVPLARGIPADTRPGRFEAVTAVFQVEEIDRVVKRQDREDAGRTYDSSVKQHRLKVVAFEKAPAVHNGSGDSAKAKPSAKAGA